MEILKHISYLTKMEMAKSQNRPTYASLQEKLNDYEILLQMMISFFKNFAELDKNMLSLEEQYRRTRIPKDVVRVTNRTSKIINTMFYKYPR